MITRLAQIGVVALWLTMTFWLVRTTWFPDESRFESVELREVMNAMLENWDDRAELVLLESGSEVGRMSVSATNARSEDEDVAVEDRRHRLSSEGRLSELGILEYTERGAGNAGKLSEVNARRDKFMWRTVVALDENYRFASFEVVLRFPQQPARLEVDYVEATEQIAVRVFLNGLPIVQSEGKLSELQSSLSGGGPGIGIPMPFFSHIPQIQSGEPQGGSVGSELMGLLSQWLQELRAGEASEKTKEKLAAIHPRLTAKFGRTKIAGESMAVYLLMVSVGGENAEDGKSANTEKAIRIYIGEDGRPVMIDTPFGFEAIAEVMIPDPGENEKDNGKSKVIDRLP